MLVVAEKTGQLGNRLILFAHFIAFAIENNYTIVNPSFCEYADCFESTCEDLLIHYPPQKSILKGNKFIRNIFYYSTRIICEILYLLTRFKLKFKKIRVIKLKDQERFYLSKPEFSTSLSQKPIIFCQGWLFRVDLDACLKYSDQIRAYFTPLEKHQHNVSTLISEARKAGEILVGVHIRHGDYKQFHGGKFYYSVDEYLEVMKKVEELFINNQVVFLICSNIKQSPDIFSEFNFIFANDHFVEDMYSLAQCDYIIGPPSTYSLWASFYGNVPLYEIYDPEANLSLDSFKIYLGT